MTESQSAPRRGALFLSHDYAGISGRNALYLSGRRALPLHFGRGSFVALCRREKGGYRGGFLRGRGDRGDEFISAAPGDRARHPGGAAARTRRARRKVGEGERLFRSVYGREPPRAGLFEGRICGEVFPHHRQPSLLRTAEGLCQRAGFGRARALGDRADAPRARGERRQRPPVRRALRARAPGGPTDGRADGNEKKPRRAQAPHAADGRAEKRELSRADRRRQGRESPGFR